MALSSERALDDARHLLNQFFHGAAPERFVFTLNCTDALNMAFKGVLAEGDHVITTDLEHNSVSRPLRKMELDGRITLTRVRADAGGTISPDDMRRAITPRTRLIAMTHGKGLSPTAVTIVFGALLVSALVTERIGIHAVFGAFLLGVVIPHDSHIARSLKTGLEQVVTVLLLPAFFAYTGMRTQIGLVSGREHWLICGLIIVVASLGLGALGSDISNTVSFIFGCKK